MRRVIIGVLGGVIAALVVFAAGYMAGLNADRLDAANTTITQAEGVRAEEHAVLLDKWDYEKAYQKGVMDNEAKYNNLATRILRGDFGVYEPPATEPASSAAPAATCASERAEAREFRRRFDELLKYSAEQAQRADQVTEDYNLCSSVLNRYVQATQTLPRSR